MSIQDINDRFIERCRDMGLIRDVQSNSPDADLIVQLKTDLDRVTKERDEAIARAVTAERDRDRYRQERIDWCERYNEARGDLVAAQRSKR